MNISNEAREAKEAYFAALASSPYDEGKDPNEDIILEALQLAIDAQRERDAKVVDSVTQIEGNTRYIVAARETATLIAAAIRSAKP
jgi:hypothetical protein